LLHTFNNIIQSKPWVRRLAVTQKPTMPANDALIRAEKSGTRDAVSLAAHLEI
jgi:hypothetical protein